MFKEIEMFDFLYFCITFSTMMHLQFFNLFLTIMLKFFSALYFFDKCFMYVHSSDESFLITVYCSHNKQQHYNLFVLKCDYWKSIYFLIISTNLILREDEGT